MDNGQLKEQFIRFANIADRVKGQNEEGKQLITLEEKAFAEELIEKMMNNPEYRELLEKIINAPQGDALPMVEEFFQEEKEKEMEGKPEEEQIAEVFGVSANQIKHLYLKNGKEIFSFYSPSLGRDIVLENSKKGKSITEILKELQEESDKYQSDNPEENSNDIMMDERLKSNIELPMYPPKEVEQHMAEVEALTPQEQTLLDHLITHAEELDIKLINIENLIYIDNNHEIKEITFDKDFKPVTSSPEGERNTEIEEDSNSKEEIDSMVLENTGEKEDENEKDKKDAKQLVYFNPDQYGYVSNLVFILAATCVVALSVFILLLFSMN